MRKFSTIYLYFTKLYVTYKFCNSVISHIQIHICQEFSYCVVKKRNIPGNNPTPVSRKASPLAGTLQLSMSWHHPCSTCPWILEACHDTVPAQLVPESLKHVIDIRHHPCSTCPWILEACHDTIPDQLVPESLKHFMTPSLLNLSLNLLNMSRYHPWSTCPWILEAFHDTIPAQPVT